MERLFARLAITIAALLAALAALLVALGFLCAAAYLALLDVFSPSTSALLTGLGAIMLAGLIVVGARATTARKAPHPPAAASEATGDGMAAGAAELGGALGAQLGAFAKANPKATLLASLAAGFAVGLSPKLRKALADLLLRR
ncbi:MAG: hypothetical protein KIT16_10635 [Rhodospirillaceae bacterium]|nr:hypothetical protein [Rhodospirillaceae bacterium]